MGFKRVKTPAGEKRLGGGDPGAEERIIYEEVAKKEHMPFQVRRPSPETRK